jgi:hypothetical protein
MPIVYTRLSGGLGNQLFIIYSCIATALRDKADFVIQGTYDSSSVVDESYVRRTYWDTPMFEKVKKYAKNASYYELQFSTVFNEKLKYHETTLPNTNECIKKTLFLMGYLQCPYFFDEYADTITSMLCIDELQTKQQPRFPKLETNVCAMHFRLGDYKLSQYRHPVMPLEYYKNALEYMLEKTHKKLIVLWCCHNPDKKEVKEEYITKLSILFPQVTFEELPSSETEYEELLLMSLCDHFIIPNSTFSWWSAYLCKNKDKIVCYPETWFGHSVNNSITNEENKKRMFPPLWHRISFDINIPAVPQNLKRTRTRTRTRTRAIQ